MRVIHLVVACCSSLAVSAQCLRPTPPPGGFPTTTELFVPVAYSDGYQTVGSLITPDVAAPTCGWPLVVFVHPLGQNRGFDLGLQMEIAGQGYAVWSYDVRGQGQAMSLNSVHAHAGSTLWGPIERYDLAEQIVFAAGQPTWTGIVDGTRVAVVGVSQGGAHAWQAAAWTGHLVEAPDRAPLMFPPISCAVAIDLVADPVGDWLRGGTMFSSWFLEAINYNGTSLVLDPTFAQQCRSAFVNQDPAALVSAFAAEDRGVGDRLPTSPVPILYSHAYFDFVASPLSAIAQLEQRTAPQRMLLSTIGHGTAPNVAEQQFLDALIERWLHRYLWNDPNMVDVESPAILAELPLPAAERDDPAHLWSRTHTSTLTTGSATRLFLHDDFVISDTPPAMPQADAVLQQTINPLSTTFTPTDYVDQPSVRDLANVLSECPLHELDYQFQEAGEGQLTRSATLHLRVVPAQASWQLAALLTVQPPQPGADEVMLASNALTVSDSVQGVAEDHELRLPPIAVRIPAGSTLHLRLRNLWLRELPMTRSLEVAPLFHDFAVDVVHGDAPEGSWLDLPIEPIAPRLVADSEVFDLATPHAISLSLRGGSARAGYPYFAAVGISGHQWGVPYLNDIVPIDGDWLVAASVASTTSPFLDFLGFLDAAGDTTCTLDLSGFGALPQFLNGWQFTFAAFVWDGSWAPTGAASNPCDVLMH